MASIIHQELPLSTADDEIRLLKILPGGWSDHVRIQLFIANLNHRPEYKALSYVWGEDKPSDEYRVFVNDHSISVTKNLFQALRRIRAHQKLAEEALWIDAICIDQSFTEERNHQVRIMGKIYTDCTGDQHYPALPKESFQQKSPVSNGQVLEVDGAKMDRVLMVLPHRWESPKEKALYRQSEDFLSCFGDPKEVYAEKWLFGEVWLRTLCLDMKWGQKGLTRSTDALQKKEFEDLIRLSGWKDLSGRGKRYAIHLNRIEVSLA
ncbi:hypothetical protein CcaCcLH18_09038 [Colletotrichum camelliae]|nr:hypothetical protein CcaCcLH18_09038 [Colletotrichum camelliae]